MYTAFVLLQCIGIVIGVFEIVYILMQRQSKYQALLLGLLIAVFMNSLGYLFELQATTQELAIQAIKFTYFGKSFAPLLLTLFILSYCKIKVPKAVVWILAAFHTGILLLVQTCVTNTLYYSSINYTQTGLFPHLVLGHGVVYIVYSVCLIAYLIVIPIFCIIKTRKTLDKSEHAILSQLIAIMVTMVAGLVLFLSGLTEGYDTTAIAYVISQTIMLIALVKENMLETLAVAKDLVADNIPQGLVILGKRRQLLYTNEVAQRLYPQLLSERVESSIQQIIENNLNGKIACKNDKVYKTSKHDITKGKTSIGTIYMLEDVTNEYTYADRLEKDVEAKTQEIKHMQRTIIESFAEMVEARDGDTGQHVKRTSEYVHILARSLSSKNNCSAFLSEQDAQMITDAAPLHDIGKITVPDSILTKPGKLTAEEFAIIQRHCADGVQLIEDSLQDVEQTEFIRVAENIAHYHHEKWDGTGYPCGLASRDIPLEARIMAVADVYDALRSKRSYKPAFTKSKAYDIILGGRGSHFDPDVVDVFIANIAEIERISDLE